MRYVKIIVRGVAVFVLVYGVIAGVLIAFGTAKPPAFAPAITEPFADIDTRELPELRHYEARDGVLLSYREYSASGDSVAVLLHGSSGSAVDMHPLALALQRAGITAFVPDLRGHGANRPRGDITYVGQLEDDLVDLITDKKVALANSKWSMLGFSSGAAFALRFAAQPPASELVDQYVLVSPYLRYDAPSVRRPDPGRAIPQNWASASVGRIVGLTMLNRWGVHTWDGLPVLAFPVPENLDTKTRQYSWRMYRNFGADEDYLGDIRNAPAQGELEIKRRHRRSGRRLPQSATRRPPRVCGPPFQFLREWRAPRSPLQGPRKAPRLEMPRRRPHRYPARESSAIALPLSPA